MAKGISLHIGVNRVDPNHYNGWSGPLNACEADAEDMQQIAVECGFSTSILLTENASRNSVMEIIKESSQVIDPLDILFITYSGHGGQVPDLNGDEEDGLDETWCLYDGQLIDDELHELWALFESNVRILVLSDSCHSGTVTRAAMKLTTTPRINPEQPGETPVYRYMPNEVALRTYRANRSFYDDIARGLPITKSRIAATVQLISGCQDNQFSLDGPFNGKFTGTLLSVWNEGRFRGDYSKFHEKIVQQMPATQTPNLFIFGAQMPEFMAQRPFRIDAPSSELHDPGKV